MEKHNDATYTLDDLMDILKVSRRTLQNYIRKGTLKAFRVGNKWRVTKKQYEEFIEKNKNRNGDK